MERLNKSQVRAQAVRLFEKNNCSYSVVAKKLVAIEILPRPKQQQVAQLSQRDRATGWVSYGQKWKTGTGRQYLRTI